MTDPLVIQLQADAIDQDAPITSLLRKAKLAASKLDAVDIVPWIDLELNGYVDVEAKDFPPYRKTLGSLVFKNPFHGWLPIMVENAEGKVELETAYLAEPISSLVVFAEKTDDSSLLYLPVTAGVRDFLWQQMGQRYEISISFPKTVCASIVDRVRNLVLDWTIQLEQAGIIGEGLGFSTEEKERAAPVTQNFYAQNIGMVGNAVGSAVVTNNQNAELNLDQVRDFVAQAKAMSSSLPNELSSELGPILDEIEGEASQEKPDHSRLSRMLSSAKAVCEGAAGNLVASGIVAHLTNILG